MVNTNLKGTFLAIKACVPHLKKSSQGRIIITSSITGPVTGYPGWTHYGATKAGQLGFMRTACIEPAKYGITVNAIAGGFGLRLTFVACSSGAPQLDSMR